MPEGTHIAEVGPVPNFTQVGQALDFRYNEM